MYQPSNSREIKGLVFNIQRFSVHDGPGIRTTVFMKGCLLKCLWCSNPESQDFFPDLMVIDSHCRVCGACAAACPQGAISIVKEKDRRIDRDKCDRCFVCIDACIYASLQLCGNSMGVTEVLDEIMKDMDFYKNSDGGVTISGGEALGQAEFVAHLLAACKKEALHTALDTSGYAPWRDMEKILPLIDLILWDIKHLDPLEHKRATGVGNKLILKNLKRASRRKRLWLRMPLIADFNDSPEHVKSLTDLGQKVGAEKISLLPYHEGGKSKCHQLGRSYRFPRARTPGDEHINLLKGIIKNQGLKVTIGS
ncbi:MAG: glycyl-radical enzyme activating protein [Planctomycetota bacterium]|jgi:pyruvate formate lyase activating enzyme